VAYRVPFIDVPKHFLRYREPILSTIEQVLMRGNLILREELREFETNFASLIGVRYGIGVGSGTDAVHLALRAIGFAKGDEVITVSHTCIATVAAIVHAGATPVLIEVGEDYNMDPDSLEEAITPRTRAIIPVHLNGRSCDMDRILAIAQVRNLIVLEDAAQGLGARFNDRPVGSFGVAGCFSVYPFKMLGALGDGGIVVTDDSRIAEKVRQLRDLGENRETGELLCFGFSSRLDNMQAALVNRKLEFLSGWIKRRREIAKMYQAGLAKLPGLRLPHFDDDRCFDVFLNYCIRTQKRNELVAHLKENGVEPLTPLSIATPIHRHPALGLGHISLPRTEQIAREFLYLPTTPEMDDSQVNHVIDAIQCFSEKHYSAGVASHDA
jgi:dTDP-4-amino-4,6-dideoxygalactose transaminase